MKNFLKLFSLALLSVLCLTHSTVISAKEFEEEGAFARKEIEDVIKRNVRLVYLGKGEFGAFGKDVHLINKTADRSFHGIALSPYQGTIRTFTRPVVRNFDGEISWKGEMLDLYSISPHRARKTRAFFFANRNVHESELIDVGSVIQFASNRSISSKLTILIFGIVLE